VKSVFQQTLIQGFSGPLWSVPGTSRELGFCAHMISQSSGVGSSPTWPLISITYRLSPFHKTLFRSTLVLLPKPPQCSRLCSLIQFVDEIFDPHYRHRETSLIRLQRVLVQEVTKASNRTRLQDNEPEIAA
jgi:hypothetical protein